MRKLLPTVAAALVASTIALLAANSTFFTSVGDLVIPISPPNQATGAPGAIDNMNIGATTPAPARVTTLSATDQVSSAAGLPTIGSGACGATTNGAVVAGSTNQSGRITIGAAATTTCTVSFSKTLGVAPNAVVLFPANAAAAATGTTVASVSSVTTAGFVFIGSALANANYYYVVF